MLAADKTDIEPFVVHVLDEQIADLRERLRRIRLPEAETVPDWEQGVPLADMKEMVAFWLEQHNWRRVEAELNSHGQWRTTIFGLGIHFMHVRSPRADAKPLLITHGWPGSIIEFLDILTMLTDPPDDQPAFHVVAPSLPGFGFSDKPAVSGWNIERIADAWAELMTRLDYPLFVAAGGDWGAMITTTLAVRHPDRLSLMHTVVPWAQRPADFGDRDLTDVEAQWLADGDEGRRRSGHGAVQAIRPQTFGYGLVDSPAGQLAWILEAYLGRADHDSNGRSLVPPDRMIDGAALYWFTSSGASSARLYWESLGRMDTTTTVTVPCAVSVFPKEVQKLPRAWVESRYISLRYWNVLPVGGHFAMLEVPDTFAAELRAAARYAD